MGLTRYYHTSINFGPHELTRYSKTPPTFSIASRTSFSLPSSAIANIISPSIACEAMPSVVFSILFEFSAQIDLWYNYYNNSYTYNHKTNAFNLIIKDRRKLENPRIVATRANQNPSKI